MDIHSQLSSKKFNDSDLRDISKLPGKIALGGLLFFMVLIPLSFLFGFLGLLKNMPGYWHVAIILSSVFAIAILFHVIRSYFWYRKDLSKQIKLIGNVIVKTKSTKKGEYIIKVSSPEIEKLNLLFQKYFDKVEEGDLLYIEISKYSKHIFQLSKNKETLINKSNKEE